MSTVACFPQGMLRSCRCAIAHKIQTVISLCLGAESGRAMHLDGRLMEIAKF